MFLRQEDRQHGMGFVHVRGQIGVDDAGVILDGHLLEPADHPDPDAAEPQVDAVEHLLRRLGEGGDRRRVGDVQHLRLRRAAGGATACGDIGQPLRPRAARISCAPSVAKAIAVAARCRWMRR